VIVFMLAAGLGTRLRPVTNVHPKPCVPFLNVPMGLYAFRYLNSLSVEQLVINTFHLPEKIRELYQSQPYFKGRIDFSNEQDAILGSSGGLKKASHLFNNQTDQSVLMMNADEILFDYDPDFLKKAYNKHLAENNWATLVVMKHPDAGGKFGAIWCEDDGRVKVIGKVRPSETAIPYHYIGFIFLNREILATIPDDTETNIFYDILKHQLSTKKVGIYEIACNWYETGNYVDYFLGTETVLQKIDADTLAFINQYDESVLVPNKNGVSLISKSVLNLLSAHQFESFNVVSKTTNPNSFKNSGSKIENKILFYDSVIEKPL
jgi:mannose-1-phosphate guanylyltransferase